LKKEHIILPNKLVLNRIDQPELLDLGEGSARDVAENLAEMQRINDMLGGTRALTRHLYPRLLLHDRPVRLADLGTGGAGIPVSVLNWARRLKIPLQILGVDWSQRSLAVAARRIRSLPEISLLQADALCMPFKPGQFDYIVSSLVLHHFSPNQLVDLLQQCYALAARSVIMTDLARGWLPFLGFKLLQPVLARNYLTRHDGALSVRRAYTPREMHRLALLAGIPNPRVFNHFPGRMTLVVDK
jgi:SAM-dependent methyltransferase